MKTFTLVRRPAIVMALALSATVAPAFTPSFDAATGFSLVGNPNGPWSYGYSQSLGSPLIPHATSGISGGLEFWNTDIWIGLPWVARNSTAAPILWSGTALFAPGALTLHPGAFGEVATVRFTVPVTGQYLVNGAFFGQDIVGPTTTDAHILLNGTSLFDTTIADFGTSHPFNIPLTLVAGSQLDFAVGYGPVTPNVYDSNYYDSTGLAAQITLVPEPTTPVLAGFAAVLLGLLRRRKNFKI